MAGTFWFDLRHVLRRLRRSPGFTLVAVASLAIGIGANTAMFGVVSTLLLTPLPVEAPDELVLLAWGRDRAPPVSQIGATDYEDPVSGARYPSNFNAPLHRALRDAAPGGVDVFAFAFVQGASIAFADQPALLAGGALVSGRYFPALRPSMAVGRPLDEGDDRPGAPLVAVLGHSLWMRAFGGDPAVVGRSVRVNGVPVEIVGVTGEGFRGLSMGGFFPRTEITLPISAQPRVFPRLGPGGSLLQSDDTFWLRLMARIPRGTSAPAAEQVLARVLRTTPSPLVTADGTPELRLLPGARGAQPVSPDRARLLWFLLGVAGIVLAVACVNLASLMLARGVARRREMALRRALGAGRAQLTGSVLLEGLVLSALGTALGVGLVLGTDDVLGTLLTGSLGAGAFGEVDLSMAFDSRVLAAAAVAGVGATVFFGLLSTLGLPGVDPGTWLKSRTGGSGPPRLAAGRLLVALQVGISLPLVVGATLFLRSVAKLGAVELGFEPEGLASFPLDPAYANRPAEDNARLYLEVLSAVLEIPGVRSASLVENVPLSGLVSNTYLMIGDRRVVLHRNAIGPGFVETLGMRLLAGRVPGLQDGPDAPRVGAVNETAVRELFGGASPIGRSLDLGGGAEVEIVGVVNDTPYRDRRSDVPPTLYESALQRNGYGGHNVIVRTDGPPSRLEPAIRAAVFGVDPDLPVPTVRSQTEVMAQSVARERVFTWLLTAFGSFALLLAAIGLHGVTSYAVSRRTAEIGVRLAVGAHPGQVLWMILRQVIALAGLGLVVGVPLSLWVAPIAGSLLYGVAPRDGATLVGSALLLVCVAAVAGVLPARRAAGLDARTALTSD